MEVSGQRNTSAALYPLGKDPGAHWIGGWGGGAELVWTQRLEVLWLHIQDVLNFILRSCFNIKLSLGIQCETILCSREICFLFGHKSVSGSLTN
jgi:hypothetical protein